MMTPIVKTESETANVFRQVLHFDKGGHLIHSDTSLANGGAESAPSPHDLFDASLAACKALTAHSYAKRRNFPLERVIATLERDDSKEAAGQYGLSVTLQFVGPLTEEQKARLFDVVSRCPVHKLMTTTEITIEAKRG